MGLSKSIKDELNKQGKSVAWLSRETGIPASTLRSALSKDRDNLSIEMVYLISSALGVTIENLSNKAMSFKEVADRYALYPVEMMDAESLLDLLYATFVELGYNIKLESAGDSKYTVLYGKNEPIFLTNKKITDLMNDIHSMLLDYCKKVISEDNNGK